MSPTPPVGIRLLDDVIPDCEEVCAYLESQLFTWSPTINNEGTEKRKSQTLFVPMLSWRNPKVIHEMNRSVWAAIDQYAKDWEQKFSYIEDVSIQRYKPGDFYKTHVDDCREAPRVISAVAYLNTVEEGGETHFDMFDFGVSPVEGRLAIFPSNYIYKHQAKAPVSGVKVAAAYWAVP